MYELFLNQNKRETSPAKEDEAMLARRPLLGWTCVSCEKNLTNYYGQQQAEYQPWGKFPFRDPSDRIARIGQGFSKMLSMVKSGDGSSKDLAGKQSLSHMQFEDVASHTIGDEKIVPEEEGESEQKEDAGAFVGVTTTFAPDPANQPLSARQDQKKVMFSPRAKMSLTATRAKDDRHVEGPQGRLPQISIKKST